MLAFELVYFIINVLITWFLIGSFYLIFKLVRRPSHPIPCLPLLWFASGRVALGAALTLGRLCRGNGAQILLNALPSTTGWLVVEYILTFLYGFNTAVVFILSIGNDPVWTRYGPCSRSTIGLRSRQDGCVFDLCSVADVRIAGAPSSTPLCSPSPPWPSS